MQTAQPTSQLPGGLSLEEHALEQFIDSEGRDFVPVESTQEEILAKHQQARAQQCERPQITLNSSWASEMMAPFGNQELVAIFSIAQDTGKTDVDVTLDGNTIFTASAGTLGTGNSLHNLWTYDNHWGIEFSYITITQVQSSISFSNIGKIVQDGEILNDLYGYQRAFSFQLMAGKPFYFFKKEDQIGLSYAGETAMLGYDEIKHYGCCSSSRFNPIHAETMVSFFARKDETWYYVEIGIFE